MNYFGTTCDTCGNITNYADDSTFHVAGRNREDIQTKIEDKLEKIEEFLSSNKLTINVEKTRIMEIMLKQKRSRAKGTPPTLKVGSGQQEEVISTTKECFLLGGTLQYNLSWQAQIETGEHAILPQIRSKLGALKYCCRNLPISSKKLLVTGLIISKLIYLLPVYGGTCKKYLDKLQVIQNNAARFVTGHGRRTSKSILMRANDWLDISTSVIQMWRIINLKTPLYLYNKLRILEDNTVETTIPRIQNTETSYRWRTVRIWNSIPQEVKEIRKISSFKKNMKNWIIESRPPEIRDSFHE